MKTDWLALCRRSRDAVRDVLDASPSMAERVRETGLVGEGGDLTLEIDAAAEEAVFVELSKLHIRGERFTAVSEERGIVDFGGGSDSPLLVVIDPIDGSLNAKRGIPHYSISIAVAEGPTMADVVFGYVHDFGVDEEWVARRGKGAFLNDVRLDPMLRERRTADGKLEVVGIEASDPVLMREVMDGLAETAHRLRALGSMAVSLCHVAGARFDGMLTVRPSRAVDVAAGQLIAREGGAGVNFTAFADPLSAPLDLAPHSPVAVARTAAALTQLTALLEN